MHRLHEVLRMCSDSEKNMSAFADQNQTVTISVQLPHTNLLLFV